VREGRYALIELMPIAVRSDHIQSRPGADNEEPYIERLLVVR